MKRIAFLAACIAAAATVPARAQTTPPPAAAPEARVRRNPNLITAAELEGQTATDVYEVVRRLRPQWLRARPTGSLVDATRRPTVSPMTNTASPSQVGLVLAVFVDGSPVGDVGELRRLQVTNVRELRFVPSADAVTRWGRDYRAGVIEVTSRPAPTP
ncbi:MAG: hypothetical protein ACJ8GN_23695 [Longimicrobiaceae bacterium]